MSTRWDVVIIGAGPYGLAAAAHLRAAGIDHHVFGTVMDFWKERMPDGMRLRSSWDASNIADPDQVLTLDAYQHDVSGHVPTPVPLDDFVAYGEWFQRHAAPDPDLRRVSLVESVSDGFRLTVDDGEIVHAQRVIVATGIAQYAYRPPQFGALPEQLATHSSEQRDLSRFRNQFVIVVGGGQSAIETAALVHEAGADVEVVARADAIHWLTRSARLHNALGPAQPLLYPWTDVGPPVLNWIVALPDVFRRFPRALQRRIARRSIRPAAASWLVPRMSGVALTTGRVVSSAVPHGDAVRLRLDDQTERDADHVILATGYQVDVARLSFIAESVSNRLAIIRGYPSLKTGFESSVPGLHFLGAAAAESFGPLMRFVSGTRYSARALTKQIRSAEWPAGQYRTTGWSNDRESANERLSTETRT